jgi:hypothetical protein
VNLHTDGAKNPFLQAVPFFLSILYQALKPFGKNTSDKCERMGKDGVHVALSISSYLTHGAVDFFGEDAMARTGRRHDVQEKP